MRRYIIVFLVGLGVFSAFAGDRLKSHSDHNHFVYQADAFLRGKAAIERKAGKKYVNDWANYTELTLKGASADTYGSTVSGVFTLRKVKNRWRWNPTEFKLLNGEVINIPRRDQGARTQRYFVSFPPGPAVVMMPFVAVFGYGTNDVLLTVLFAAFNLVLFLLVLQRFRDAGYIRRSDNELTWFVLLFGFGTAHLWCAVLGQVWFTALIMGVSFHVLFILCALDTRHPILAGIFLGCAFATRASLVFAAVFFYWQLFVRQRHERNALQTFKVFCQFSIPCLVIGGTLLWFNHLRFEQYLEFGHYYLRGGGDARVQEFGLFDPRFLNKNLAAAFTLTPRLTDAAPYIQLTKHGMSIFLTTPVLFWVFGARNDAGIHRPLWLAIACIFVPVLFYHNTGWEQFGYRFILDVIPYLVLLLACSALRMGRLFKTLILVGILVNALGAATFQRAHSKDMYGHFLAE